ncbi:MAG: flagellar protein FlgN [Myxococcales bacterium]|nr:flagellar protein FlgN [Myxococcales bacterium]
MTHLDAERDRLQTLCTVLDEESAALRRMALDDIIDIAQRKQGLLEAHQVLAQARSARLAAIGAQSLDECVARCSPAQAVRLAELRTSMAELARHATERNAWNHAFAESGRALVEGALRVVRRLHAGSSATYAANGQVTAGERRTRVDRRA